MYHQYFRLQHCSRLVIKNSMVWSCVAFLCIGLAGCASELAYRDGKSLIEQGHVEAGLAKLQEAVKLKPDDAQYRSAYLRAREQAVNAYLDQANRLMAASSVEGAKILYQRVLSLMPSNQRAAEGLAAIETDHHVTDVLNSAEEDVSKQNYLAAKKKISDVLKKNPNNDRAIALKHTVDEKITPPATETPLSKAYKKDITIEFKDVPLKQIFEVISRSSGLNFLFDKDVKTDQRTSIFLKHSSIESVIHLVLRTNQLEQQVLDGNTVMIYPNTAAKQKDYQELLVQTFFLTNADAKTVANTIKTIVKPRDLVVDEKLNMLIIRDSPEAIRQAEKLIALQDVAEPEVMLEVEVLEVQKNRLQDLGIQWPASISVTPTSLSGSSTSSTSTSSSSASTSPSLSVYDLLHQTKSSLGVTVGAATANANVQDLDARLLTNPRIRVRNHEKAKIVIGERIPNITSTATSTGFVSQSITYMDIGLTLNVEPTVYLDDSVGIRMALEVSSILGQVTNSSGTTAYQIGTRSATTVLRLKNGETDVLAGLISNQERTSGNKIPGVGDMPVVGRLFGATTDDDEKTEIVLSITPHLIRNIQRPDPEESSFLSGTETSWRERPAMSEPVNAVAPVVKPVNAPIPPSVAPQPSVMPPVAPAPVIINGVPITNGEPTSVTTPTAVKEPSAATLKPEVATATNLQTSQGAELPNTGVTMQLQGPNQVTPGKTLQLALTMRSAVPVVNVPVTLGFDPTRLQIVGVSEGNFLKQSGQATTFTSRVDSGGQLVMSGATNQGAIASSPVAFANITFRALSVPGPTTVALLNSAVTGVGGVKMAVVTPNPFVLQITQ